MYLSIYLSFVYLFSVKHITAFSTYERATTQHSYLSLMTILKSKISNIKAQIYGKHITKLVECEKHR